MRVKAWSAVCMIGTAIALVVAAAATMPTQGAQTKPAAAKLPAAVEGAFKKAYPQARIKNVIHETEDGQEQYEIESVNNGLEVDANYKPDGTVIVIEQALAVADVPAAVITAITKRYPKATLTLRERAVEGHKTYYEIGLQGAPVKTVQLTPEGKWISPKR